MVKDVAMSMRGALQSWLSGSMWWLSSWRLLALALASWRHIDLTFWHPKRETNPPECTRRSVSPSSPAISRLTWVVFVLRACASTRSAVVAVSDRGRPGIGGPARKFTQHSIMRGRSSSGLENLGGCSGSSGSRRSSSSSGRWWWRTVGLHLESHFAIARWLSSFASISTSRRRRGHHGHRDKQKRSESHPADLA